MASRTNITVIGMPGENEQRIDSKAVANALMDKMLRENSQIFKNMEEQRIKKAELQMNLFKAVYYLDEITNGEIDLTGYKIKLYTPSQEQNPNGFIVTRVGPIAKKDEKTGKTERENVILVSLSDYAREESEGAGAPFNLALHRAFKQLMLFGMKVYFGREEAMHFSDPNKAETRLELQSRYVAAIETFSSLCLYGLELEKGGKEDWDSFKKKVLGFDEGRYAEEARKRGFAVDVKEEEKKVKPVAAVEMKEAEKKEAMLKAYVSQMRKEIEKVQNTCGDMQSEQFRAGLTGVIMALDTPSKTAYAEMSVSFPIHMLKAARDEAAREKEKVLVKEMRDRGFDIKLAEEYAAEESQKRLSRVSAYR